jgi:antitoxin CcdA
MSITHFDTATPKKATNLSINADLLRQAKKLNISLSQTLESSLIEFVHEAKQQQWQAENTDFIAAYNKLIEAEGLPLDQYRSF